jgi:acetyltransferase-like isoleucine patch superfamily enzyme
MSLSNRIGLAASVIRGLLLFRFDETTIVKYYRKKGAHIGDDCRINFRSLLDEPHLINIGNHVYIAQGAVLHTHDGATWILKQEIPEIRVCGKIVIEDNCFIGVNAHILPNVTIGKNSIVAAGSVVINNIPANSIAMGVPARIIGNTAKYKEKCLQIWSEQRTE